MIKLLYNVLILVSLFTALLSCKKEIPALPKEVAHQSNLVFYDHYNGEKLSNLEIYFVFASPSPEYYQLELLALQNRALTDNNGTLQFEQFSYPSYLQINSPQYLKILYSVNGYNRNNQNPWASEAEFIKTENNTNYFRADAYRKAPVDLHFKQVTTPMPGLMFEFNVLINGNIENIQSGYLHTGQLRYFFNNSSGQVPIDTTIRVYGFGDTKNIIRWNYSSYYDFENGSSDFGEVPGKVYPSDSISHITITF